MVVRTAILFIAIFMFFAGTSWSLRVYAVAIPGRLIVRPIDDNETPLEEQEVAVKKFKTKSELKKFKDQECGVNFHCEEDHVIKGDSYTSNSTAIEAALAGDPEANQQWPLF